MRVLVTGPAGFLGGEIVDQLIQRGDQVSGVSRGDYPQLTSKGVDYRQGDLTDAGFTMNAIKGVDVVIHTAAIAGVWGNYDTFYNINTLATQNVIRACRENKIRYLVFTSSPSVTFNGTHQSGVDESEPYPSKWLCAYPQTKALAEQSVLQAHELGHLETCALRPHLVWGENDPHLLARVLDRASSGKLKRVGDGRKLDRYGPRDQRGSRPPGRDRSVGGSARCCRWTRLLHRSRRTRQLLGLDQHHLRSRKGSRPPANRPVSNGLCDRRGIRSHLQSTWENDRTSNDSICRCAACDGSLL